MGFNVTMVDPTYTGPTVGEILQRGPYKLEITHSEEKATVKGDGKYVELTISVVEPAEFAGTTFFEKANTENPSAKAVEIGQRTLAGIGNAVGILEGEYSDLHHKPFVAEVTIEPGSNGYKDKNKLGRVYWEIGSAPTQLGPKGPPAAATAAVQPSQATVTSITRAAPAAATPRPWATKR